MPTSTGDSFGDFDADENTGMNAYTFSDRVGKRLSDLGVTSPQRPKLHDDHTGIFVGLRAGQYFDGRLPTVIRKLSLDQLSALYSLFSNWFAYLNFKTNMVGTQRSEAIRQKEFLWSHIRSQRKKQIDPVTGKKMSDQSASDAARIDTRFIIANAKYEEFNGTHNVLKAMVEVTDQDMKVISREVTIHQEKLRKEALGRGFAKRGEPNWDAESFGDNYGQTDNQTSEEPQSNYPRTRVQRPKARRC